MDPFVSKLILTALVGGSWVVLSTIIAERAGTIAYELLCGVSNRVQRVYSD